MPCVLLGRNSHMFHLGCEPTLIRTKQVSLLVTTYPISPNTCSSTQAGGSGSSAGMRQADIGR